MDCAACLLLGLLIGLWLGRGRVTHIQKFVIPNIRDPITIECTNAKIKRYDE